MKKKFLYLAIVMFSMSTLFMAISFRNSFALPTDWYNDYEKDTDTVNKTITLTRYIGSDTEIVIPAKATIDGVEYSVIVKGGKTNTSLFGGKSNITKITFENGVKGDADLRNLFYGCSGLTELNLNNFDTSATTTMYQMFRGCNNLTSLDVSKLDTSNVTSMEGMFQECSKLTSLDLTNFNTSKVTSMTQMFMGVNKAKNINVSSFDTSKVTDMSQMFQNCTGLRELDISNFSSASLENIYYMFKSVILNKIKIGNFNFLYPSKNAYTFGRGTWTKLEDGKDYAIADIVFNEDNKDISGTYVKKSNIIEEMFIGYNVTFQIGKFTKIDEMTTTNDNIKLEGNKVYIKNLNKTTQADYTVPGNVVMLFKNVVTDVDGNKYNFRITIDNIHIYNLNNDTIVEQNFVHPIFSVSSGNVALSGYNYYEGTTTEITGGKSSPSKMDITMEIVDDNGVVQEGNYVFAARDLDIPDALDVYTNPESKYYWSEISGWGNYSEGINLLEGYDINSFGKYRNAFIELNQDERVFGYHHDEGSEFTEFTIKADARKFKYAWTGQGCATTVLGYYQPQFVEVIKQDGKGNNLAGAKFELYSGENKIAEWTSTEDAHKIFLNAGYYTLKEKAAPNNYVASNDIHFYVDVDGSIIRDGNTVENITVNNTGKPVRVIVNYIDETTNELLNNITDTNKKFNDTYTSSAKSFDNYILTRKPEHETVTLDKDETVLNYYYVKISGGVIEKHIDIITNKVLFNATHTGNVGDDYNIPSKTFEGYDLVTDRLPNNNVGKMKEEVIEVVYYYKPKAEIKVKYIDKESNEPIIDGVDIEGYVDDDYQTEQKEFPGYEFVEVKGDTSGKLKAINEDVIYYYKKVVYITTEVEGGGGTITGDETVDYHGDSTEDNIIIEADEGYFIRRITINGKEIEIADDNKMILSNFTNMEENKHVVVEFEPLTPDVPKTDINSIMPIIGIVLMLIGVLFVFLSSKRKSVSTI